MKSKYAFKAGASLPTNEKGPTVATVAPQVQLNENPDCPRLGVSGQAGAAAGQQVSRAEAQPVNAVQARRTIPAQAQPMIRRPEAERAAAEGADKARRYLNRATGQLGGAR